MATRSTALMALAARTTATDSAPVSGVTVAAPTANVAAGPASAVRTYASRVTVTGHGSYPPTSSTVSSSSTHSSSTTGSPIGSTTGSTTSISTHSSSTTSSTTTTTTPPVPVPTDHCSGGSGPGGLAGLCSYSCSYGYCPSPCTCTPGTPGTPPPLSGDRGYALLDLRDQSGSLPHSGSYPKLRVGKRFRGWFLVLPVAAAFRYLQFRRMQSPVKAAIAPTDWKSSIS